MILNVLYKINKEIGTTIILCEHRLEGAFAMANRVVVLDEGEIIADSTPRDVGKILKHMGHDMFYSMPASVVIYESVAGGAETPITVAEGRRWLTEFIGKHKPKSPEVEKQTQTNKEEALSAKNVFFKYFERKMIS